eukprot:6208365-Pleurochrysis_carterae.AAC.1
MPGTCPKASSNPFEAVCCYCPDPPPKSIYDAYESHFKRKLPCTFKRDANVNDTAAREVCRRLQYAVP